MASAYDNWKLASPPEYRSDDDAPPEASEACDGCRERDDDLMWRPLQGGGQAWLCADCRYREAQAIAESKRQLVEALQLQIPGVPTLWDEAVRLARTLNGKLVLR